MKKIILSLTSLAIPASHAVTVIDDFLLGSTDVTQTGIGSDIDIDTGLSITSTIGGTRIARAHNVSGSGENSVSNTTVPGRFDWSLETATTGHFHLYYGYNDYTLTGAATNWNAEDPGNYNDLVADFSAQNAFTIRLEQADVPDTLRIGVITNRGEANEAVVLLEENVASSPSPQTVTFNFADFSIVEGVIGDLDWANVDQIIVEVGNDLGSADWSLTQIQTVPEPSSALLGLVGLLGLARRRR